MVRPAKMLESRHQTETGVPGGWSIIRMNYLVEMSVDFNHTSRRLADMAVDCLLSGGDGVGSGAFRQFENCQSGTTSAG